MNDSLLAYCRESFVYRDGELLWRERPVHHFVDLWRCRIFNSRQAGKRAGTMTDGYLIVNTAAFGRLSVHRVIFLMHHGYLPEEVDHIDGDPTNNKIENLRPATHAQNMRNVKTSVANRSGRKGVYWHKSLRRWTAGIRVDGKQTSIGAFDSMLDAVAARIAAEREHYGEFSNER